MSVCDSTRARIINHHTARDGRGIRARDRVRIFGHTGMYKQSYFAPGDRTPPRARARVTASRDGAHGRDERRVRADERGEDESPAREVRDATDIAPRRRDATRRRDDATRRERRLTTVCLRDSIRRARRMENLRRQSLSDGPLSARKATNPSSVRRASRSGRPSIGARCDAMRCDATEAINGRWGNDGKGFGFERRARARREWTRRDVGRRRR